MDWDHFKMTIINEVFCFLFCSSSLRMGWSRLKISGCNFKWALSQKDYCVVLCFVSVLQDCISVWRRLDSWTHRGDDGRSVVTSPSRCHECEAGPVITDNEMSPPEAHNGDEIINALEVEQIQIPLMLDKRTAQPNMSPSTHLILGIILDAARARHWMAIIIIRLTWPELELVSSPGRPQLGPQLLHIMDTSKILHQ